jgi:hypothetical protein
MEQDFEQMMNDKMEQASLKELMPGFDGEAEWNKLSKKLRPVKTRSLWLAWSHAAALLLGIITSWFLIKQRTNSMATIPMQVISTPAAPAAIVPLQKKTVNNALPLTIKKVYKSCSPAIKNTMPQIATGTSLAAVKNNVKETTLPATDTAPIYTSAAIVPTVKKPRQRALNILDVANEDREFMVNDGPLKNHSNALLNQMFYLVSTPAVVANADQPIPLRGVFGKQ